MTRLPLENRAVEGLDGPQYPKYRVPPICAHPLCSRTKTDNHHLWRRSFLVGDFWWVQFVNPDTGVLETVGNIAGLCLHHHMEVTVNEAEIRWLADGLFWWYDGDGSVGPLQPQPPRHGHQPVEHVTGHKHLVGPAGGDMCGSCGQRIRKANTDDKREGVRRRKTWVVKVPDDGEDGALVLDTLLDACGGMFAHDTAANTRYFTLVQALALVVQNQQFLVVSDRDDEGVSPNLRAKPA